MTLKIADMIIFSDSFLYYLYISVKKWKFVLKKYE